MRRRTMEYLDALGRIHQHQGSLAGSKGSADFIAEINMARGINQV